MILDTITHATRKRVEAQKTKIPPEEMCRLAEEAIKFPSQGGVARSAGVVSGASQKPFETALKKPGLSFICEIKKASPSSGIIAADFPYLDIARDYERAGADAISVLTEPVYFLGRSEYLKEIREHVSIPVLRKDFIIDDYQLYEARVIGADAVLLICALLDTKLLRRYLHVCDELGLSALVEAHDEAEVRSALSAGARIIGVNNRDLKTFEVDLSTCVKLRPIVPKNVLFVAESGIKTPEDIEILRNAGVDAVLIGETLMRRTDKKAVIKKLKGA